MSIKRYLIIGALSAVGMFALYVGFEVQRENRANQDTLTAFAIRRAAEREPEQRARSGVKCEYRSSNGGRAVDLDCNPFGG